MDKRSLQKNGWKTATAIIDEWNSDLKEEHPTIVGQIIARLGLHNEGSIRSKEHGLYSPTAQSLVDGVLRERYADHRYSLFGLVVKKDTFIDLGMVSGSKREWIAEVYGVLDEKRNLIKTFHETEYAAKSYIQNYVSKTMV